MYANIRTKSKRSITTKNRDTLSNGTTGFLDVKHIWYKYLPHIRHGKLA